MEDVKELKPISSFQFVENAANQNELPENFREHLVTDSKITLVVSAQFSENNLRQVLKKYPDRKIEVINMRKEPYALIEGSAVGVTDEHLEAAEAYTTDTFIAALKKQPSIEVDLGMHKVKQVVDGVKVKVEVSAGVKPMELFSAISEEQFTRTLGVKYREVPISDHGLDAALEDPKKIDEMVAALLAAFQESEVVYLHCQGGKSRSPTAAVMAIILLEARTKSFAEIKSKFADFKFEAKKIKHFEPFFQSFHKYAAENDPSKMPYSEWLVTRE